MWFDVPVLALQPVLPSRRRSPKLRIHVAPTKQDLAEVAALARIIVTDAGSRWKIRGDRYRRTDFLPRTRPSLCSLNWPLCRAARYDDVAAASAESRCRAAVMQESRSWFNAAVAK